MPLREREAMSSETISIRSALPADVPSISAVINDAAHVYRGVIPADQWHEPYMPLGELLQEIARGVAFSLGEAGGALLGVMGLEDKGDVALIRHAYVATTLQRKGVGTRLLRHVEGFYDKPILIGTWAAATWAIEFYRRNGYQLVPASRKDALLHTYWSIPERQVETSVVLADRRWFALQ